MDRARPLATALFLVAATAAAHEDRTPKRDEIEVGPSEVVIALDYVVPPGDLAATLRKIFDRDHSGTLDEGEETRLGVHLVREAAAFLALTVDGKAVTMSVSAPVVDARGASDDAIQIHAQAVAHISLPDGPHLITIADHHKDRRMKVPAIVHLQPGALWRKRPLPLPLLDEKHPLELQINVVNR